MKNIVLVLGLALLVGGCGKSDCEEFGDKLCEMACDCAAGSECVIVQGALTISHDSESDCKGFWVQLGCMGGGEEGFDYAGCSAALDNATCVDTGNGTMGLEYPSDPVCMSNN